jgi:hypothetical protein
MTVLFMDNHGIHFDAEVSTLLSKSRVKIIIFPPHTSGLLQMLDLVFFAVMKREKRNCLRDPDLNPRIDHARRVYSAFE